MSEGPGGHRLGHSAVTMGTAHSILLQPLPPLPGHPRQMHGPLCSVSRRVSFPKDLGQKGWDAASLSPNKRVLPAHSRLPSRSCIFLAVAHPYTWRLHYLCSEFPSCSKTLLSWELLPHPQTLTRAPKAPFYSMTRFLESTWSSASCPELVYCGLRPLPWESRPFLSTEEPVSTYFLAAAEVCIPSPLGRADISFLCCGGMVGVGGGWEPRSKTSRCEPRPCMGGGPPPSSSLILPHPP